MWAMICSLAFTLVIGLIFDILGRRIFTTLGTLIVGICFGCLPLSNNVYPEFLIMRIFL